MKCRLKTECNIYLSGDAHVYRDRVPVVVNYEAEILLIIIHENFIEDNKQN